MRRLRILHIIGPHKHSAANIHPDGQKRDCIFKYARWSHTADTSKMTKRQLLEGTPFIDRWSAQNHVRAGKLFGCCYLPRPINALTELTWLMDRIPIPGTRGTLRANGLIRTSVYTDHSLLKTLPDFDAASGYTMDHIRT